MAIHSVFFSILAHSAAAATATSPPSGGGGGGRGSGGGGGCGSFMVSNLGIARQLIKGEDRTQWQRFKVELLVIVVNGSRELVVQCGAG